MKNKKTSALSVYLVLMIIANIVLAFFVGKAFVSEKNSEGITFAKEKQNTEEQSEAAQTDSRADRPVMSDFSSWFYVTDRSIPAKADLNVTREDTYGSWRATVYVTGKKAQDDKILLLNIELAGEEGNVTVTLDWYQSTAVGNSETTDETSKKDTVLNGIWKNGAIVVSDGQYEFEIPHFYRLKGKEYGMGSGTMDGLRIDIGLVRDEQ